MVNGGTARARPRVARGHTLVAGVAFTAAALSFCMPGAAGAPGPPSGELSTTTTVRSGTGTGATSTTTKGGGGTRERDVFVCPSPPGAIAATAIGDQPNPKPLLQALDDLDAARATTNVPIAAAAGFAVRTSAATTDDTRVVSVVEEKLKPIIEKPSGIVVDTTGRYADRLTAAGCTHQASVEAAVKAVTAANDPKSPGTSSTTTSSGAASPGDSPIKVEPVQLEVKGGDLQPMKVDLAIDATSRLDLTNVQLAFAGLPATATIAPNLQLQKGPNTVSAEVTVQDPVGAQLTGTLLFAARSMPTGAGGGGGGSGRGTADLDRTISAESPVTLARPRGPTESTARRDEASVLPATSSSTSLGVLLPAALVAAMLGAGLMYLFGRRTATAPVGSITGPMPVAAASPAVVPLTPWPTRPPPLPGSWVRFLGQEPLIQIVEPEDAMRIAAQPMSTSLATWSSASGEVQTMAFWAEKIEGKGEDANPTFAFERSHKQGLIAVYDGMGGAGAAPARQRADGSTVSSAYVASRVVKEATQTYFKANRTSMTDPAAFAQGLHDELTNQLATELQRCLPSSSKISGSLRRDLPTTLAAVAFSVDPNGGILAVSLWAGDSRTHLLTPQSGLQQLTRDDTHEVDALQLLINDAPMTNVVCADRPFEVHHHAVQLHAPAVLVAATDGCFGYVATPSHYELLLLRSLQRASSLDEWAQAMARELDGFTSDDSSLVLTAIGYQSFDALREAFAARAEVLEREHAEPFAGASPDDFEAFSALRAAAWERYRPGYEQLLPMLPTDRPDPDLSEGEGTVQGDEGRSTTTERGAPDATR